MKEKVTVLLLNLGGPTNKKSIRAFLYNLFSDPLIIRIPKFLRIIFAFCLSYFRSRGEANKIYSYFNYKSPIIEETNQQSKALLTLLNQESKYDFQLLTLMRYWPENTQTIIKEINQFTPDKVVLLPLYPQFSTATTQSSINQYFSKIEKSINHKPKDYLKIVCCYSLKDSFVQAHTNLIKQYLSSNLKDFTKVRFLFSAHGLPLSFVKQGDPYQWQIEQLSYKLASNLQVEDFVICYQSKVGWAKWLTPDIEGEIKKAAQDKIGIVIIPISFVSEHSETLYELDVLYRDLAKKLSIPQFFRVPTLSVDSAYMQDLKGTIEKALQSDSTICSGNDKDCCCPNSFSNCPMNGNKTSTRTLA